MLARGVRPVVEEDVSGPPVRLGDSAGFELNHGRGIFDPSRKNAARAVVFEAARDKADAVREQR